MKKKDLEQLLMKAGWIKTAGGRHDKWIKEGCRPIPVPRHREINELTAKSIIKQMQQTGE